jgi:hypothetical protein
MCIFPRVYLEELARYCLESFLDQFFVARDTAELESGREVVRY